MEYLIKDKEQFLAMQAAWREEVNSGGKIRPEDHIMYNAIRGYPLDRGFTPVVKQARLDAGHRHAFDIATDNLKWQIKLNKLRMLASTQRYEYFKFGLTNEEMIELCTRIFL